MGIDLVTLIAQIINLLILIWLLKRFLYRPVLNMLQARQDLIADQMSQAKKARKDALAEENLYKQKVADFDADRGQMLQQVKMEANALREKLTADAKKEVADLRKSWLNELSQEKQSFEISIQNAIVKNFKLFASDALKDMAGVELNALVLKKFKEKLGSLSAASRRQFAGNLAAVQKAIITTDTRLDNVARADLKDFIITTFELDTPIKFEFKSSSDLICGIQVQVGEQLTSWSLQSYLQSFENNMDAAFNDLMRQGA